jgi:hypothetical protein
MSQCPRCGRPGNLVFEDINEDYGIILTFKPFDDIGLEVEIIESPTGEAAEDSYVLKMEAVVALRNALSAWLEGSRDADP